MPRLSTFATTKKDEITKRGYVGGITHIAGATITPIINHKIITRNCNIKERDYI